MILVVEQFDRLVELNFQKSGIFFAHVVYSRIDLVRGLEAVIVTFVCVVDDFQVNVWLVGKLVLEQLISMVHCNAVRVDDYDLVICLLRLTRQDNDGLWLLLLVVRLGYWLVHLNVGMRKLAVILYLVRIRRIVHIHIALPCLAHMRRHALRSIYTVVIYYNRLRRVHGVWHHVYLN